MYGLSMGAVCEMLEKGVVALREGWGGFTVRDYGGEEG